MPTFWDGLHPALVECIDNLVEGFPNDEKIALWYEVAQDRWQLMEIQRELCCPHSALCPALISNLHHHAPAHPMPAFTPATPAACPLLPGIPMDMDAARQLHAALLLCQRCQKPGHFAMALLPVPGVEQEELLLQLLAVKDATRAPLLDEPTLELTPEEISACASPPELESLCLSIENETAFSDALHSEIEEAQCPPSDIQTLTLEPLPSSPTPPKVHWHGPAWVRQMPQQYVMASALSTNSLCLDVEIKTMETQQTHRVTALLDSRVMGLFLDSEFVKCHGLTMQPLPRPIPVYNINRTPDKAGTINSMADLVLCYQNHMEHAVFAITSLGRQNMILGFMWLQEHNTKVKWTKEEVTMSRCPPKCSACATENRAECWTQVQEHTAICACCTGPLPFADLDLLDPPPLAFPHREALYENNWSNSGALEEEHGGEFGGICKPELLEKAVEVEDQIYATVVHLLPSIAEIQASQTTSQWLAQAFTVNATP
ncbi:hypothetical protein E4T56_gene914 [Termitomyces sp. T112]|nr:hypothetical protein E4T56_gene914 [Termitomyces sp. T112]